MYQENIPVRSKTIYWSPGDQAELVCVLYPFCIPQRLPNWWKGITR